MYIFASKVVWLLLVVYIAIAVQLCITSAQSTAQFTLTPPLPLIDVPFTVDLPLLPAGSSLFASPYDTCLERYALGTPCTVSQDKKCTFTITRSSLNRQIQDDSKQTLYWCTAGRTSPLSSFDLYAVYYNPRYYFASQPWTVTFSEALPIGSVVGISHSFDCSGSMKTVNITSATRQATFIPLSSTPYFICARIPNSTSTLTDFIPVNVAVYTDKFWTITKQAIRYNLLNVELLQNLMNFTLSSSNTCRDFAQPVLPSNQIVNITAPSGVYYICALQYGYQQYGIYVPSSNILTVRDYSVSPRVLYEFRETILSLSTDAQRDNVKMGLFRNTGGQRTQIADWSSSPIWNLDEGVYEARSHSSSNPSVTWYSRTVVVRPTPLVKIKPVPVKLGLSVHASFNWNDVLLLSGYIGVTLQTKSDLVIANSSTLTDNMALQVAPGKAQELLYKITVPYNTSCPTEQLQDNVNDDSNNINCQPYNYTIGSVSAVPYYLQYTPLIALREVNFTLDDTVTLRTGAAIKFVPYNGLCTDAPLGESLQFELNDPSIRSFTLTQFPFPGIWQFCINEVNKENNGFKSVLELNVHDVASVTPLSFIPALPATVTITKTPVNTSVYLTNSTTCYDDNVVVRATSNATGVATLSFTLRDENDVLLVCVQYDGGVERGVSQSSVISVGSITPSPLSFTPTSLINKHETQVDFDVHSGSQLSSGTASAYITSNTQCDNSTGSVLSQSDIHNADNTPYTKPYARFFINIENIVTDRVYNVCVCYRGMCVPAGNVEIVKEMTLTTLPSTATAGLPVSVQLSGNAFIDLSPDTFVLIPMISDNVNKDRCAQYSDGLINSYVNGIINSNGQTTQEFTLPVNVSRAVMCVRNSNKAISFMFAGILSFYSFTSRSRFVQIGLTNDLDTWPEPSSTSSLYLIPYNGPELVNITDGKNLCSDSKIRKYYTSSNQRLNNDTPTGTYLLCESVRSSSMSSLLHVVSSNNTIYAVSSWSLTLPSTPIRPYVTFDVQLSGGNGYRPFQQYAMEYAPNLNEEEKWSDIFININSENQQNGNMNNNQFDVEYDEGSTRANYHHYNYTTKQHISPFANQLADINTPYKLIIIPASTTCYDYDKDNSSYDLFYFTPSLSSSSLSTSVTITNVTPITEITFCLLPSDDDRITLQRALLQTYMEPSTIVSQEATLFIPGNNGIASQSQAKLSDNAECNGNVSNIAYLSTLGNYYNLTLNGCNNSQIAQMTEVYFCEGTGGSGSIGVLFRNMGKVNILRRSVCPSGGAPASITNVMTPPASPITSFGINTSLLSKPFLSQSINCAPFADNMTLAQYGYSPELNENAIFYVCAFIIANPTQIFTTLTPTLQVKNWEITPSSVLSRYNATMGALPIVPQLHISHVVPSLSEPFISLSEYCDSSLMSASPFITENATLPFSTTAMNGMAYVCLSSSAPTITSIGTTSTTPFAIAQFLIVTPPFVSFVNPVLFKDVPFYVRYELYGYGLNEQPLYSMIPNADVNYTYHGYYVMHTRRVFLALQSNCNDVVSEQVNVSDNNSVVIPSIHNASAFTQNNVALCAETPAGVAFLRNVPVINDMVYPKTFVTGTQSILYLPQYIGKNFKWSAVSNNCDNIDNRMSSFTTNATGYATVNMKRNDDGSNIPFGIYTLCVGRVTMNAAGNMVEEFNNPVDKITLYPLLHYGMTGNAFVVNVLSTVYLRGDLNVNKLVSGLALTPEDCVSHRTNTYGTWRRLGNFTDRIQLVPMMTVDRVYLCARVDENNTIVAVRNSDENENGNANNAGALRFTYSSIIFPTAELNVCSTTYLDQCELPSVDFPSSSSSSSSNNDNLNNKDTVSTNVKNGDVIGEIGVIDGDCCNAADRVNLIGHAYVHKTNVNPMCALEWNESLSSQLDPHIQLSVCAWRSDNSNYCATLRYMDVPSPCTGNDSGNADNNANKKLHPWVIAIIVILVLLFLSFIVVMAFLHFYCGCFKEHSCKEMEESRYLSSCEAQEHVEHLNFVPETSSGKRELTVNNGYLESSTQSSSHSSNNKLQPSYYYNNIVNPLCNPSQNVTLKRATSNNMSENHNDVKVSLNPFTVDSSKRPEQTVCDANGKSQSNGTMESSNLCNKDEKEKKSDQANKKDAISKSKYADAHSLDMEQEAASSFSTFSPAATSVTASTSVSTLQSDSEASVPSILIRRRAPNWRTPEMNVALSQYQQEFDEGDLEHEEEASTPQGVNRESKYKNQSNSVDVCKNNGNGGVSVTEAKSIATSAQRQTMIVKNCKTTLNKNNYLTNILHMSSSDEDDSDLTNEDATVASVEVFDLNNTPEQKSIAENCNHASSNDKKDGKLKRKPNDKLSPLCDKSNTMKDVPIAVSDSDEPVSRPLYTRSVSFVDEEDEDCSTSVLKASTRIKRNSPNGVKTENELVDSVQSILHGKINLYYNDSSPNKMSDTVKCDDFETVNKYFNKQSVKL